ncbi:MAG: GYD domain-containing protein [Ktedonobacterales bacterium]
MATYVTLINWTDQGVRNAKDTVQRARAFRSDLERRGGKLVSIYWTQGQYDIVTTVEAPDGQTVMAALLAVAGLGNVRTETLSAFNETEMESVIQKV